MLLRNLLFFLLFSLLVNCQSNTNNNTSDNNSSEEEAIEIIKSDDFYIEGPIFTMSYNEVYEQPNWIEYQVRDIVKVADRDGMQFYAVDSVHTSDNDDYYNNVWDRGHLAPD